MAKETENKENAGVSYNEDLEKFEELAKQIRERYKLSNYDLIDVILKKRVEKPLDMIPVSIFDNEKLSALEAIVKYMKENLKFSSGKTAKLLNRNISTISSTHLKARKKMPSGFLVKQSKHFIPISEISNRSYSVLECIVVFLKKKHILSNSEIAKLLNRDSRTIWTVYSRAKKKESIL